MVLTSAATACSVVGGVLGARGRGIAPGACTLCRGYSIGWCLYGAAAAAVGDAQVGCLRGGGRGVVWVLRRLPLCCVFFWVSKRRRLVVLETFHGGYFLFLLYGLAVASCAVLQGTARHDGCVGLFPSAMLRARASEWESCGGRRAAAGVFRPDGGVSCGWSSQRDRSVRAPGLTGCSTLIGRPGRGSTDSLRRQV